MGPVNPAAQSQTAPDALPETYCFRWGRGKHHPLRAQETLPADRSRGNHSERHRGANPPPRNTCKAAKDAWLFLTFRSNDLMVCLSPEGSVSHGWSRSVRDVAWEQGCRLWAWGTAGLWVRGPTGSQSGCPQHGGRVPGGASDRVASAWGGDDLSCPFRPGAYTRHTSFPISGVRGRLWNPCS